jgi:hypothetical protein
VLLRYALYMTHDNSSFYPAVRGWVFFVIC